MSNSGQTAAVEVNKPGSSGQTAAVEVNEPATSDQTAAVEVNEPATSDQTAAVEVNKPATSDQTAAVEVNEPATSAALDLDQDCYRVIEYCEAGNHTIRVVNKHAILGCYCNPQTTTEVRKQCPKHSASIAKAPR